MSYGNNTTRTSIYGTVSIDSIAIKMIAFIKEARLRILPFSIGINDGEAAASTDLDWFNSLGSLNGTKQPIRIKLTTFDKVINQKVLYAAFEIIALDFLLSDAETATDSAPK